MSTSRTGWNGLVWMLGIFIFVWFAYPYLWMVLSTSKNNREVYDPSLLLPSTFSLQAFQDLFSGKYLDFKRAFLSSVFVSFSQAFICVFITALFGYLISRLEKRLKILLFAVSITIIVIPKQSIYVPVFQWMEVLGIRGEYSALILPGCVSGIGVIFFVQVFRKIPRQYIEISCLEGASEIRTFLTLVPMVIPALLTYGVIHFILSWHEHLLPLLLLDDDNRTLPLALSVLNDPSQRVPQAVVMAASVFTILPVAFLFGLMYRKFKSSMSEVLVD